MAMGEQESDGVSPTAIRELMLRELKHEHIIHLDSVHLNRQARQPPSCLLLAAACNVRPHCSSATVPSSIVATAPGMRPLMQQHDVAQQDPCLSLAFDYAEHDLYAMIAYHRERLRSAPISAYTLKSVMWQLLNGLSYLEQVHDLTR